MQIVNYKLNIVFIKTLSFFQFLPLLVEETGRNLFLPSGKNRGFFRGFFHFGRNLRTLSRCMVTTCYTPNYGRISFLRNLKNSRKYFLFLWTKHQRGLLVRNRYTRALFTWDPLPFVTTCKFVETFRKFSARSIKMFEDLSLDISTEPKPIGS